MTDILERAAAALEGVTSGPWRARYNPMEDGFDDLNLEGGENTLVITGCGCCGSPFGNNVRDADFIALARQLVPDMAAEIAALRARVEAPSPPCRGRTLKHQAGEPE